MLPYSKGGTSHWKIRKVPPQRELKINTMLLITIDSIRMSQKDVRLCMKLTAKTADMSLNDFVITALDEKIERDSKQPPEV